MSKFLQRSLLLLDISLYCKTTSDLLFGSDTFMNERKFLAEWGSCAVNHTFRVATNLILIESRFPIYQVTRLFLLEFKLEPVETKQALALRKLIAVRVAAGSTNVACLLTLYSLGFTVAIYFRSSWFIYTQRWETAFCHRL